MAGRVTMRDVEALWGPATPQFAFQIADRLIKLVSELEPGDPVRRYAEARIADLHALGHETTKGPADDHH